MKTISNGRRSTGINFKRIKVKSNGLTTTIILNRPDKLNAIDAEMREELETAIHQVAQNPSCRAVIITGCGKAFCSGDDINYLNKIKGKTGAMEFSDKLHSLFNRIESLDKLVVAAINGYCLGGGCELAMACDIRIATKDSIFGFPEVKLGLLPCGGGTYRLPALVGIGRAKELLLCGEHIDANKALRIGLINRIVSNKSLMEDVSSFLSKSIGYSYNAMKNGKTAINFNIKPLDEAEKKAFVLCFSHLDRKEGLSAFIEHRKPRFD